MKQATLMAVLASATSLVAQVSWTTRQQVYPPWYQNQTPLVHDTKRDVFLVFGVLHPQVGYRPETWQLRGSAWTLRTPRTVPSVTSPVSMTYDSARDRVVMLGLSATGVETWEWDDSDWTQRAPTSSPPLLRGGVMYYDAARARTVCITPGATTLDIWSWDGTQWSGTSPASGPSVRTKFAIAVDPSSGLALLFGGYQQALLSDTWLLVGGTTWLPIPGSGPPARASHAMCFDSARGRFVLYGGLGPNFVTTLGDTWEWDGAWHARTPRTAIRARAGHSMLWDALRERSLLFAGYYRYSSGDVIKDLVMLDLDDYGPDHPAAFTSFGQGCAGPAAKPAIVSSRRPWLGEPIDFAVVGVPATTPIVLLTGASSTQWGPWSLPLALAPFGLPGCTLYSSIEHIVATTALPYATPIRYLLPSDSRLLGAPYYHQALAFDPAANAAGIVVSAGAALRIGGK